MSQTVGIYTITNTINHKVYYGSSTNCERRWAEHRTLLQHNKHYNTHLQRAWNKYSAKNFIFNIIEVVSKNILEIVEQQYLDYATLFPQWSYNISKSVEHTNRGIKFSVESRKKMSDARKGIKHSEITKRRMSESHIGKNTWAAGKPANNRDKTIYTFKNIKSGEIFSGIRVDFQKKYNLSQGTLGTVINGKRLAHKNWVRLIT
jgi:group I intron endonuclease